MASSIQILRSTIAKERPFPGSLLEGQPAVNVNASEPGLFFKASDGSLLKIGPAAVTSDGAPPNTGGIGEQGNCVGELWLDKSLNPPVLKIYDGAGWIDAGSGGGGNQGAFVRWVYTAAGGETSLSGPSGGVILAYEPGLEEVFVNGVLITRGVDYSATNGSSISNLQPLAVGDVVTVTSIIPLSIVEQPGQVTLLRWSIIATAGQIVLNGADTGGQTLDYDPGFEEVFVNGVFLRRGLDYSASNGNSITLASPLTSGDEITVLAFSQFSVGALNADVVNFIQAGVGAESRTVQSKLRDSVSVKDFGASGNTASNAYAPFDEACSQFTVVSVPPGNYTIGTKRLGEYQKPLEISGSGPASVIRPGSDNVDDTIFRVGAVGGAFGDNRAITKFENLAFKPEQGAVAPWAYTGIDVAATFPIVIKDVTMLSMGPRAVKMRSCFYGYVDGLYLVDSGLDLYDVNNIEFSGGDIRPLDTQPNRGITLFGAVGEYPVRLEESDLIKFTDTTFEAWECPVIELVRSYTTVFNGSWFEGNTGDHVISFRQAQTVEFNSCQLDFAVPYGDCFVLVDNSGPGNDENRRWRPFFKIDGGYLLTTSVGFGDCPEFIKSANGEKCNVLVEGVTFRGGPLFADEHTEFDVRSLLISGALHHSFYSKPNAQLYPAYNRWIPNSSSLDWDFSSGPNFTASPGLTVATTTAQGEFLTGSRGVKIGSIPSDGTQKAVERSITGMGPVATEGETYLVYIRVKSDRRITFQPQINGGFLDFANTPQTVLPPNTWRDYVFKTAEDVTWAQGRFNNPTIKLYVTNDSGGQASLFIDRIDYEIVNGDYQI